MYVLILNIYYFVGYAAQCSKIGKRVQFQKYKNTLFAISKMAKKINFCTRKMFKTSINAFFGLFSGAKIDFSTFLKMQIMCFCTLDIALFSNFRALCLCRKKIGRSEIFQSHCDGKCPNEKEYSGQKNIRKIMTSLRLPTIDQSSILR